MTRAVVTFCRLDQLSEVLRGVCPTGMVWPPRLHEKLLSAALAAIKGSPATFQKSYEDAMAVAHQVAAARRRDESDAAAGLWTADHDGVVVATLDRPPANALNRALLRAMTALAA